MLSITRLPPDPSWLDNLLDPAPLDCRWAGQLAHDPELMLAGTPASIDQAKELTQGFSPLREGKLLKTYGTKAPRAPRHRKRTVAPDAPSQARGIGFDISICAPLGLSMLVGAARGDRRQELLTAHAQAVAATVRFLEDQIHHRFIVLQVDHPVHEGCAFVHTHNVVFSISRIAGAWSAFTPSELKRHEQSGAAFYNTTLATLTPHG